MSRNWIARSISTTLLALGLAACDRAAGTPLAPQLSADDSRVASVAHGGISTPTTVDGVRVCRPSELPGLTEAQIEAIRALYAAFNAEVAEDLRIIHAVEQAAREAAAAGASAEEVAQILARADLAKREVAEAEKRLREAIDAILDADQRRRHCVASPDSVRSQR